MTTSVYGIRGWLRRVLSGRGSVATVDHPRARPFVLHCFNDWLEDEQILLEERRACYVATYGTPVRKVVQS